MVINLFMQSDENSQTFFKVCLAIFHHYAWKG